MRRPGNYLCQTILHTLKFQDDLESKIMIKGIAIIKYTANKSGDEGYKYDKNSYDKFVKYAV